jgi:pimeloyl-ACP methyl ester carboxylesterase
MAVSSNGFSDSTINVGGTAVSLLRGGSGRPLLVLHEELGHPGWLSWHSELAGGHSLLLPVHPGFGVLPRVGWVSGVRDLAGFYSRMLRGMALGPVDVIGFSLGGWIAAEMAAADAEQFRSMTLVAPAGVRPPEGEILDLFIVTARAYLDASVHDAAGTPEFAALYGGEETTDQFEAWEDARAESARLAWKPYMHNPSLPHLLEGVQGLPTLIIWGRDDRIIPLSAGQTYNRAISGSELLVFDNCGHRPEIEKTSVFFNSVRNFLAQQ